MMMRQSQELTSLWIPSTTTTIFDSVIGHDHVAPATTINWEHGDRFRVYERVVIIQCLIFIKDENYKTYLKFQSLTRKQN